MYTLCHRVLGPKHPDALWVMGNLVMIYDNQGQLKLAEELQLRAQVLCHKVLGAQHPDTLRSMAHLVVMYMTQGWQNDAQDLALQVKVLRLRVLGENYFRYSMDHAVHCGEIN